MASVSTSPRNAARLWKINFVHLNGWQLVFVLTSLWLMLVCQHQLGNGYAGAGALNQYAGLLLMRSAEAFRFEHLGYLSPFLVVSIGLAIGLLPGMPAEIAPYMLDILACAALVALAWHRIAGTQGKGWAWLFAGLVALHPFLLWTATAGEGRSLGMLLFYFLCDSLRGFIRDSGPSTYMRVGGLLCVLLLTDPRAGYLCVALLPWLSLIMPLRMLKHAPQAFYLVCYTPTLLALSGLIYLNWLYLGDGFSFLRDIHSAFRGGYAQAPYLPWLQQFGGQWLHPLLTLALLGLSAFPLLALSPLVRSSGERTMVLIAVATVLCAGQLATLAMFASHPLDFLSLLMVPCLLVSDSLRPGARLPALLLLLVALPTGWAVLQKWESAEVQCWRQASLGPAESTYRDEKLLGQWLASERVPTLMDERSGYAVIAARGDAQGLIVSYEPVFKAALINPVLSVAQVIVAEPHSRQGANDAITQRFPRLWEMGQPGYSLVYEQGPFRVWRHND